MDDIEIGDVVTVTRPPLYEPFGSQSVSLLRGNIMIEVLRKIADNLEQGKKGWV